MIENGALHYLSWKDGEPPLPRGTGGGDGGKSAARGSFGSGNRAGGAAADFPPSKSSSCDPGSTSSRRCWLPPLCTCGTHRWKRSQDESLALPPAASQGER